MMPNWLSPNPIHIADPLNVIRKEYATSTNNHIINTHFPAFLLAAAVTNKAENKDDGTGLCSMDG
jgi:hypothetical protein